MTNESGFGYKGDEGNEESTRSYHLSESEWTYLFAIVYLVAVQGAAVSVYTSRDRHALAVSIKAGKDRKAYWIGPDDIASDVFDRMVSEWGIRGQVDPLGEDIG